MRSDQAGSRLELLGMNQTRKQDGTYTMDYEKARTFLSEDRKEKMWSGLFKALAHDTEPYNNITSACTLQTPLVHLQLIGTMQSQKWMKSQP
jgi:hypothetical protein